MGPDIFKWFRPGLSDVQPTRRELRRLQQEEAIRTYQSRGLHHSFISTGLSLLVAVGVVATIPSDSSFSDKTDDGTKVVAPQKETLPQLVQQARQLEDGFRDPDLSNKAIRDQYTWLMAGIFDTHFPSHLSRDQLFTSIVLVENHNEFIGLHRQTPGDHAKYPTGFISQRRAYIDLHGSVFQLNNIRKDPTFPKGWNPLKSLRTTEVHEWFHLTVLQPNSEDQVLELLDPSNASPNKWVFGFRIENLNSNFTTALFEDFDEATTELLSIRTNSTLFGTYDSDYASANGRSITESALRLNEMIKAARISGPELGKFHAESRLGDFLLLLDQRAGIGLHNVSSPLRFGLRLIRAVLGEDDEMLNYYLKEAGKR